MTGTRKLVSVIIPVYNVEKLLGKCIESVVKQTYYNIEIIVVDDGSTDSSGKVCDSFNDRNNVTIIHQENAGLSGARNAGMSIAKGDYLFFLDSDDYLALDTIETLVDLLEENDADVSVTRMIKTYDDGTKKREAYWRATHVLNTEEALECLLFDRFLTQCVCGKLWKRELWDGIECPKGLLFEEHYTTYKLIERAKKIVYTPTDKYYYYQRIGSITHNRFKPKTYDLYNGINEEYTNITKNHPDIERSMMIAKILWEQRFVNMMLASDDQSLRNEEIINNLQKQIKERRKDLSKTKFITTDEKFMAFLFGRSIPLYIRTFNAGKKHMKMMKMYRRYLKEMEKKA